MKLHTILLVLALLAVLSTAAGGYFYFHALRESAFLEADHRAAGRVNRLQEELENMLSGDLRAIKALAGLKEIREVLENPSEENLDRVNLLLDLYRDALEVNVCYLMDERGMTLASSNRFESASFVGKDYSFRPYFKEAIAGHASLYMALGVTSYQRGLYCGHPVYGSDSDRPLGVLIIKQVIDKLELMFDQSENGDVVLADPRGIVFASSREDWIMGSIWKLTPKDEEEIKAGKQFGPGPWRWLGFRQKDGLRVLDDQDAEYLIYEAELGLSPGWTIIYLRNLDKISNSISMPLRKNVGFIILVLIVLVGLAVSSLYASARYELEYRNLMEQALKESEERFRSIVENAKEGIFITDDRFRFDYVNEEMGLLLGCEPSELVGVDFRVFLHQNSRDKVTDFYIRRQKGEDVPRRYRLDIVRKNGEIRNIEVSASTILHTGGMVRSVGLLLDITERIKTEKALAESEEIHRTVLEGTPNPVVVYDMDGRVMYLNPAFTKVFGWTLEERLGEKQNDFVPEEAWPETRLRIEQMVSEQDFQDFESQRLTKDGRMLQVGISASVYRNSRGEPIGSVVNIRDISEQKNLETQLRQAQKMEAVGTLASGIAHDFNNLLQAISGNIQLILAKGNLSVEQVLKYLHDADFAVERASDLVQRLLTFSRKVVPELRKLDLGRIVIRSVELLQRTIPKMIEIETRLAPDLEPVNGDETQLEQVLMNLAGNAKDAMPRGGRLIIKTLNVDLDEEYCRTHVEAKPGRYVMLQVTDTGVGIGAETMPHIFEPFFTTKSVGEGTGLGLSSIYGIVKSHKGHIACESRVGDGTTFRIFLPALRGMDPVDGKTIGEGETITGGSETILLVDDEPAIREIAKDILESSGYSILEADCGEDAIEVYRHERETIDLIILDLGMPGMGGFGCLEGILRLNPKADVLIASGYGGEEDIRKSRKAGARGFIRKPYRLTNLLAKVREVLDGGGAARG